MRLKSGLQLLCGSCIIYLVVSCIGSAMDNDGGLRGDGGGAEPAFSGADSALYDSLVRPAKEARAADGNGGTCHECPTSGTRIQRRMTTLTTTDGARLKTLVGWYDAQRQENCEFGKAPDGKVRCLPQMTSASIHYRDSSCATPLIFLSVGACFVAPQYVLIKQAGACDYDKGTIYALGGLVDTVDYSPVTIYRLSDGGYCQEAQLYGASRWQLYEPGNEIPPSSFAEATEVSSIE